MKASSYVSSFYFYKLAQGISSPYTSLEAYSAGTIDANGNIIKPESSIDSFEYLVIKLKKIFEELPYGTTKAKLSNYMATLNMFGEQFDLPTEEYNFFMEGFITANVNEEVSYIELLEDMTTGGGAGPGPGGLSVPASPEVSQGGVAGYDPILGMGLKRRKKPKYFDNCEVFEVCPEEYISFKSAKQWKDVPDSETKNYLQRFQRRNKKAKIGIKSVNPLNGDHDLYWINYPGKDFIEEKFDPSDASREITNRAVKDVIEPPEIDYTEDGNRKRGTATQRAGFLFSTIADLIKGGKKHQEQTAEVLLPHVGQEVSTTGIDTHVYDETKGIFVPADLKADTTTPKTDITASQVKGMPRLSKLLKDFAGGGLTTTEKETARGELKKINRDKSTQGRVRQSFSDSILSLDKNLQWVMVPGKSDKPFNYSGLVTRVPTRNIERYAQETANPSLGLRAGKSRTEVIARGREPSVEEVAQQLQRGSFNTSKDEIVSSMERLVSGKIFRRLQSHLKDYLRRVD
jgi:hypothetical protein